MNKIKVLIRILLPILFFSACHKDDKQPNVLFISVDDLNDWIGAMGDPQAITPNMDRLFDQGVLFTNAHCNQAVCTASRNSLLSGLYPSTTGWYASTNDMKLNFEEVMKDNLMLPEYFRRNGYKTMGVGKVFHNGLSDFGMEKKKDFWTEAGPTFWKEMEPHIKEAGFGYRGWMFYPFPKDGGQLVQSYGEDVINNEYRESNRFYSLCGGPLDKEDIPKGGMYDENIADWGISKLQENYDNPFFLAVGFIRPHVPYAVPRKYFDLYDPEKIIMPEIPEDEMSDIPMMGKSIAYGYSPRGGWGDVKAEEKIHKELVHSYLASVSFVDDQIGRLLDAFVKSEYADNTIIVFWSDHGQHLGEKCHFRKQALWEESTHVPFFIKLPKSKVKGHCDEAVSLIDIYPTLVEACNLPVNTKNEGVSLLPQLHDVSAEREHPVLSVWKYKNYAVRSKDFRYIQYRDGSEELYDHRTDPNEHYNLAQNAEFKNIIAELKKSIPQEHALPAGKEDFTGDNLDKLIEKWEKSSIPIWLE